MEDTHLSELKNRLESILFSSGKPMQTEELSRITKERDMARIQNALLELKKDLEDKKSSIMLIQDGSEWKLTIREQYIPFVRKVVTTTELPKTILETLAIVAYKSPAIQSQIIKIRTNKAYRHLDFLEEKGYITREKKGRSKLIKLTQKFFEYFDLPPEKLKEKFAGFKELEKVINQKETELEKKTGKTGEIEEYDTLETYEDETETFKDMLGGLQIYNTEEKKDEKTIKKIEQRVQQVKNKMKDREFKAKKKEMMKTKTTKPEKAEAEEERKAKAEEKIEAIKKEIREEAMKPEEAEKTKEPETRLTPEKIQSEAKKKKAKPAKYASKGMFPEGMPAEIQEKVDEKVQEMLTGKEKEEDYDTHPNVPPVQK
jgi:segregation and condensation protein B